MFVRDIAPPRRFCSEGTGSWSHDDVIRIGGHQRYWDTNEYCHRESAYNVLLLLAANDYIEVA